MERQYVSSSNIASIGYDPDNQVLEIEFLSGAVMGHRTKRILRIERKEYQTY